MEKIYAPIIDNGMRLVSADFMFDWIVAWAGTGRGYKAGRISDPHIGRGMNRASADFLKSDCDAMVVIDGDIRFSADALKRLLSWEGLPFIGGLYAIKSVPSRWCAATLEEEWPEPSDTGLIELRRIGRGFVKIRREVFEEAIGEGLAEPYVNHGREEWNFWNTGVVINDYGRPEYLCENWWFCDMVRKLGHKVLADVQIIIGHDGTITYPVREVEPKEETPKTETSLNS